MIKLFFDKFSKLFLFRFIIDKISILKKWITYFLLAFFVIYAHNDVVKLSSIINNNSFLIYSYIIKLFLLGIIILVFIKKELNFFKKNGKSKMIEDKNLDENFKNDDNDSFANIMEKEILDKNLDENFKTNDDDPFAKIRRKKTLNMFVEK